MIDITVLTREELEDKVDEQRALLEAAHEVIGFNRLDELTLEQATLVDDVEAKIAAELGL